MFYGVDNDSYAHAVSPGSAAWKCMRELRGRLLFQILPQRGDRAAWYFLRRS